MLIYLKQWELEQKWMWVSFNFGICHRMVLLRIIALLKPSTETFSEFSKNVLLRLSRRSPRQLHRSPARWIKFQPSTAPVLTEFFCQSCCLVLRRCLTSRRNKVADHTISDTSSSIIEKTGKYSEVTLLRMLDVGRFRRRWLRPVRRETVVRHTWNSCHGSPPSQANESVVNDEKSVTSGVSQSSVHGTIVFLHSSSRNINQLPLDNYELYIQPMVRPPHCHSSYHACDVIRCCNYCRLQHNFISTNKATWNILPRIEVKCMYGDKLYEMQNSIANILNYKNDFPFRTLFRILVAKWYLL